MVADLLGSLQIFLDVMQMWCLCELSKKLFVALGHRKKKKRKKGISSWRVQSTFSKTRCCELWEVAGLHYRMQ